MNPFILWKRTLSFAGLRQAFLPLRFARPKLASSMLFLIFLTMNFQMLSLVRADSSGMSIKVYHLMGMLALPIVLGQRRVRGLHPLVGLFSIVVITVSLFGNLAVGWNPLIINYLFAFYICFIALNIGRLLDYVTIIRILRAATLVVYSAVFIKTIFVWDRIAAFLSSPWGHPDVPLFYGGGTNLEASWLAISSVLFMRTRLYYPLVGFSLILSALYASRVGTIIAILALLYPSIPATVARLRNLGVQVVIAAIVLIVALPFVFDTYVFDRFLSLGTDPGSIGRLSMWQHVGQAFLAQPFGYGAGNALTGIESVSGLKMSDSNLHNIYGQTLLDFGIVGFVLLCLLVIGLLWREIKGRFEDPLGGYILLYCVAGAVQFRGGDALVWFIVGFYSLNKFSDYRKKRQTKIGSQ